MPYKLSIWIVLFLFAFNGGAIMLDHFGVDDYMGVDDIDTGDTSELDQAESQSSQFETGSGGGSTLLGTYNRLGGVINTIVNAVNPGAQMMKAAGVPVGLVNFAFGILGIIPAIDVVKFIRSG